MVRNYETYNQTWSKTPVFKLDPETLEKEIKGMNSKTMKLTGRFSSMKTDKSKTAKNVQLEGPLRVLDSLSMQIKDYIKFTPLVRVFSNPGMKERHWTEVSKYTQFPVNP